MDLVKRNLENKEADDFVFAGRSRGEPIAVHTLVNGYFRALDAIGIDEAARKERSLTFHGHRPR